MAGTAQPTPELVSYLLRSVSTMNLWVHRRVEMIVLRDQDSITRRVSVDFTLPDGAPPLWDADGATCHLVPLTFLRRNVILRGFDCRDEEGIALPVLNDAEQKGIERAMLVQLASPVRKEHALDQATVERAVDVVRAEMGIADSVPGPTTGQPDGARVAKLLLAQPGFTALVGLLTRDFLLITELPGPAQRRRVVKFCYDQALVRGGPGSLVSVGPTEERAEQRRSRKAGRQTTIFEFPANAASQAESYHLGLAEPPELRVGTPILITSAESHETRVLAEPGHIRVSGVPPGADSSVYMGVRIKRDGWLRASLVSAWITVIVLYTGAIGFSLHEPSQTESAAAVVVGLVGLLPVVAARTGEHAMATQLLSGVRSLLVMCSLLALAAAASLAFFPTGEVNWFWLALAGLGAVPALALTLAYWRAGQPEPMKLR